MPPDHTACPTRAELDDIRDRVNRLEDTSVRRTELKTLLERVDRLDERSGQTLLAVQEVRAELRAFVAREQGREDERGRVAKSAEIADAAARDPRKFVAMLVGALLVAGAAGGGGSELIQALIHAIGGAP